MNEVIQIANILFQQKRLLVPLNEFPTSLHGQLDGSLVMSGVQYGRILPTRELLEEIKQRFEADLATDWSVDWASVFGFIDKICEYFNTPATRNFVQKDLIPFIISDLRLKKLSDPEIFLSELPDSEVKSIFVAGLVFNFFGLALTNHQRSQLVKNYVVDESKFWWDALRSQSVVYPDVAADFARFSIEDYKNCHFEILRCVLFSLAGVSAKQYFFIYKEGLAVAELKPLVINSLIAAADCSETFLLEIIDSIGLNPKDSLEAHYQMPRLYASYLASQTSENKLYKVCSMGLDALAQDNRVEMLDAVVGSLYIIAVHSNLVFSYLTTILQNPVHRSSYYEKSPNSLNGVDFTLAQQDFSSGIFWQFLIWFIQETEVIFDLNIFPNAFELHYGKDTDLVKKFVVRCLCSDFGKVRYMGSVVLNEFLKRDPGNDLNPYLDGLTQKQEVIIALSVKLFLPFQYVERMNAISSLFLTDNADTIALLSAIIKNDLHDFPRLIEVLDSAFGTHSEWGKISENLKQNDDQIAAVIAEKEKINELSPRYTHAKLFNLHQRLHKEKFEQGVFNQLRTEPGIISQMKQVTLLKGGGWKMQAEPDEQIRKLQRFSTSFSVPISVFNHPEKDEISLHFYYLSNFQSENDWQEWLKRFL